MRRAGSAFSRRMASPNAAALRGATSKPVSESADAGRDDRRAERHGFQQRIRQSLVKGRHEQGITVGDEAVGIAPETEEVDTLRKPASFRPRAQLALAGPGSDQVQVHVLHVPG